MNKINHIAFIMDGNRRWAKKNNKPSTFGHEQGAKQIPKIILACLKHGIRNVSFFAFSTENWKRDKKEIDFLFSLLKTYLNNKNKKWFEENNVRINLIGFIDDKNKTLFSRIKNFCDATKEFNGINVNIMFNYGSQQEIVNACKELVKTKKEITVDNINRFLLCNEPVDLLIRTSGEQRISNFLLWQLSYSEIIFEKTLWPDYDEKKLKNNIINYNKRIRRFGGN